MNKITKKDIEDFMKKYEIEISKKKYLFLKVDEIHIIAKEVSNLNEFKDFCHYCGDVIWKELKPIVENELAKSNTYFLGDNDVYYYIVKLPV